MFVAIRASLVSTLTDQSVLESPTLHLLLSKLQCCRWATKILCFKRIENKNISSGTSKWGDGRWVSHGLVIDDSMVLGNNFFRVMAKISDDNLPSTAFTQYPSSTKQSLAILDKTSLVLVME
jgi:hypothetical protein